MKNCEGTYEDVQSFIDQHNVRIEYTMITLFAVFGIITLAGSYVIFCRRSAHQRPLFVSLQMISLFFFTFCFIPYYTILAEQSSYHKNDLLNSLATVGDIGLVIHDWIFTEAHLSAYLYLPIALDSISAKEGS